MTVLPAAHLGPDMNFPAQPTLGPWGRALHDAVRRHDVDAARWALDRGAHAQALAPVELQDHEDGTREADGGYHALHLAVVSLQAGVRGEGQSISLPMLRVLLDAGVDPNSRTTASPDAVTALEALMIAQPDNLVDACALLRERGANSTARAVDEIVRTPLPESAQVLAMLFAGASLTERQALLAGQALIWLTREPLTSEGGACVRELVRQGADLDRPVRSARGTRLPTPAQALANDPYGAQLLVQLRGQPATVPRRRLAR